MSFAWIQKKCKRVVGSAIPLGWVTCHEWIPGVNLLGAYFLIYFSQLHIDILYMRQDFLGSEVDFPVGNVSFFLFFSGHVGASLIATLDLRHMQRRRAALTMDTLNVLQILRLLATRGHYTIDLVAGAFAGWACYYVAGVYQERMLVIVSGASSMADSSVQPLKPKLTVDN